MLAREIEFSSPIIEAAMTPYSTEIVTGPSSVLSYYLRKEVFSGMVLTSMIHGKARLISATEIEKDYGNVRIRANLSDGKISCLVFDPKSRLVFPGRLTERGERKVKDDILMDATHDLHLHAVVAANPDFFKHD